jgi:hypothetical protein
VYDTRLDAGPLRVLAAVATYADDNGYCYPAVGTIGARLYLSRRTVQRHMRKLEALGYLVRRYQYRIKGGGNASNSYTVHYPQISADSSLPPRAGYDPSGREGDRAHDAPKANASGATLGVTPSEGNAMSMPSECHGGATLDVAPPVTLDVAPGATLGVTLTIPSEASLSETSPKPASRLSDAVFPESKTSPSLSDARAAEKLARIQREQTEKAKQEALAANQAANARIWEDLRRNLTQEQLGAVIECVDDMHMTVAVGREEDEPGSGFQYIVNHLHELAHEGRIVVTGAEG